MIKQTFAAAVVLASTVVAATGGADAAAAGEINVAKVTPVVIRGPIGRPVSGCAVRKIRGEWRYFCPRATGRNVTPAPGAPRLRRK
jgi:hypothetical protein